MLAIDIAMKAGLLAACLALGAAGGAKSEPVVLDFEDFDLDGAVFWDAPETLVIPGAGGSQTTVTIQAGADNRIYDLYLFGDTLTATGQGLLDWDWQDGVNENGTTILFDEPVSDFSLAAGDFGSDDDGVLEIKAYDANDQLLASASTSWGEDVWPPFVVLPVVAQGIRRVVFTSGGTYRGSAFIDDLTFTPPPTAIAQSAWGGIKALYR